MRRAGLVAVGLFVAGAGAARAQLVPLARCHAAFPCNMPYALLPAEAAANLPDAQLGNALIAVGVDSQLKVRVVSPPVSSDFAADAARLYVLKHPLQPAPKPTPAPTR